MDDVEFIERVEELDDVQKVVKDYESGEIRVVLDEQADAAVVNKVFDIAEPKYTAAGLFGDERGHAVMHWKP